MRKALFFLGCMTDSDIDWLMRNGARRRVPKGGHAHPPGSSH